MARKIITTKEGHKYERVSRWIKIHSDYVTPRHSLFEYSDNYMQATPDESGCLLDWFRYNGRKYALGQFERLAYPEMWEEKDGLHCLSGYDCTEFWNPLVAEIDEIHYGYIRLYREITE